MHNSLTLKRQGYLLTNKYIHYICADKINAMIKTNLFLLLFVLLAGTSCNRQQHFISDDTFRAEVENDFRAKQAALPDGNLFSVFNQKMTSDEKEALTFLYAYMPIGDITDYDLGRQHTGRHLPPFRTSRAGQQRESGREPHGLL